MMIFLSQKTIIIFNIFTILIIYLLWYTYIHIYLSIYLFICSEGGSPLQGDTLKGTLIYVSNLQCKFKKIAFESLCGL